MPKFINKNLYFFFAGILLIVYLFALITITIIDQKRIYGFQENEINSYVKSKTVTLEYFFDVLKKDITNLSENKILSTYFLNKALGMSMQYGLNASINSIDRWIREFILSQQIQNSYIFKDIILLDMQKNIIFSLEKDILLDFEEFDISNGNQTTIKVFKNKNDIYIFKNIFINEKQVGTLICFVDLKNIFNKLITETEQFILASNNKILTNHFLNLEKMLENGKYIQIPISKTPLILYGKANELEKETSFSKWFIILLIFLALPILFILYNLILLNNENIKLEEKIKNSIKEKENERILLQQSKVAAIGEMIGNIAHQWRQPLSVITTHATGLKLFLEFENEVSKKDLMNTMDMINNQAQYLSKTIDDFRNFFKGNANSISEFDIKDTIENVRNLTKDTFNNNFIEYIEEINSCKINGNENILIQALINIYNNAKDALTSNMEEKIFCLEVKKEKEYLNISIKDNAGGIPNNIIDKIFNPYFTTKHESVGTGIGLYMTNQIITKQFKGSIEVKNETYFIKEKEYTGAKFIILIPLV